MKFQFNDLSKQNVVHKQEQIEDNSSDLVNILSKHLIENDVESKDQTDSKQKNLEIDIDEVKKVSYNQGYEDARTHLQPLIEQMKANFSFYELLKEKLAEISKQKDINQEVIKLCIAIILAIAKKLPLVFPINLEQVLLSEVFQIIGKYYKEGLITIRVNKERLDYCTNLLQIQSLPINIKNNIEVVEDGMLDINDCKVEWQETELEYNSENLMKDIDKILENLQRTNF